MVTKRIMFGITISLCISCVALADRTLDRKEILDIFDKLTSQSQKTWIPAGTIEAVHNEYRAAKTTDQAKINNQISQEIEEYQDSSDKRELTEELQKMKLEAIPFNIRYELSNEYSLNSYVVLKYDGDRFHWEINVNSRTDSVTLPADLKDNYMTEQFNHDWNAGRSFTWDGQKYTIYSLSVNQAIVDATDDFPHVVNGPLTAGIIPWGYGYFTYDDLSASEVSAIEVEDDDRTEIHIMINGSNGMEMQLILEPDKDYAVLSCLITDKDAVILKQYDNFQLVSGKWVPTAILVQKYDDLANRPLASDIWEFTSISGTVPAPESFDVDYKSGALVSYRTSITEKPLIYHYVKGVDIEQPLAQSLALARSDGTAVQNCATAALGYAIRQLGKNMQLSELVIGPEKTTSFHAMKQFAQNLGLHCRVIKTDLETLKNLSGSKAILHLPGKSHFVFLDHIDDQYVWIVDLTGNKFLYCVDVNLFSEDWTEGTALLISKQPIEIQDNVTEIADTQLHHIIGAGGYTCTRVIQVYSVIFCTQVGGECAGYFEYYFKRYGCEPAENGTCTYSIFPRKVKSPCINDPYYQTYCTVTGEMIWYYMWACE